LLCLYAGGRWLAALLFQACCRKMQVWHRLRRLLKERRGAGWLLTLYGVLFLENLMSRYIRITFFRI